MKKCVVSRLLTLALLTTLDCTIGYSQLSTATILRNQKLALSSPSLASSASASSSYGTATVDYSAATEYVEAHYGIPQYFGATRAGIRTEQVYNARSGIISDDDNIIASSSPLFTPNLETCGFGTFQVSSHTDFNNLTQVVQDYLSELQDYTIPTALNLSSDAILQTVFWHPMIRDEEESTIGRQRSKYAPSTANVASNVHMDVDVGAFGLDGILNLIEKNKVHGASSAEFCPIKAEATIRQNNRRFVLLNIWRPLVQVHDTCSPLGILATRYDPARFNSFPQKPFMKHSRWYTFPSMQPNECLLFKQYDRRLDRPSDLWHSALTNLVSTDQGDVRIQPRRSFDIKAFVLLKETVSSDNDRLARKHSSALTLEESGQFCDCQAKERQHRPIS